MNQVFYKSGEIELWPFSLENFKANKIQSSYFSWWTDNEVTKYNSHGLFPLNMDEYNDWLKQIKDNKILVLGIVKEIKPDKIPAGITNPAQLPNHPEKIHIGNVSLQSLDWINRSAELAIVMGEPDYWGKGYGTLACRMVLCHGFFKLNLNRIFSGTAAPNLGMQGILNKLGFVLEGEFRQGVYLNGKYEDVYSYGILAEEFKNE